MRPGLSSGSWNMSGAAASSPSAGWRRNSASRLGLPTLTSSVASTKGWSKFARRRRYAYYLTPRGFAEKSRLTLEFMSYSFTLFRQAKADCMAVFAAAGERGYARIALIGASDLAEIAAICALDGGFVITAVVDANLEAERFAGAQVVRNMDLLAPPPDAVLVTDMRTAAATLRAAVATFGTERVLVPALLGVQPGDPWRGA